MATAPDPSLEQIRQALAPLFPSTPRLDAVLERFAALSAPAGLSPPAGPAPPAGQSPAAPTASRHAGAEEVPDVDPDLDLDLDRLQRCGFPEVVYGQGKSATLVVGIVRRQRGAGQPGLVTRVCEEQAAALTREFPEAVHNPRAGTVRIPLPPVIPTAQLIRGGPVFVVTAGSSDRPVAEEAMETLRWMQIECHLIADVGVAGPQRLLRHVPRLRQAVAVVCVAGMEAALPSVVGGHVPCPVIGVPTSVGYGASFQGVTAMLSMLTCCASNVVAVNIDAGFKGGYVAGLIASRSVTSAETPDSRPITSA